MGLFNRLGRVTGRVAREKVRSVFDGRRDEDEDDDGDDDDAILAAEAARDAQQSPLARARRGVPAPQPTAAPPTDAPAGPTQVPRPDGGRRSL
ncbi:MAG: hypothetical protein R3F60_25520 [bacterium]